MKKRSTPKQLNLFTVPPKYHGGEQARGKRKSTRPLVIKSPMHFVFRAERAKGSWSLLLKDRQVQSVLQKNANRFQVKVIHFANVGNHLHLLAQGRTRDGLKNFLRVFPQEIVFLITGAKKGKGLTERFWRFRPFSRIVQWGRDFYGMLNYVERNRLEGTGMPRDVVDFCFGQERAGWGAG